MFTVLPEFGDGSGGSTRDLRLVVNHDFGPAASHIRRNPIETDRPSMRIGHETQRKQTGKAEWGLDVKPVVELQPDADRERSRRGDREGQAGALPTDQRSDRLSRGTGSLMTQRWREVDSKPRSP
jgi:hypothetical protein